MTGLEQAHQFQAANGVPHGTAAHSEHLHKFAFRRQQVTGLQFVDNSLLELPGDLFVDLASTDHLELDFPGADCSHERDWSEVRPRTITLEITSKTSTVMLITVRSDLHQANKV